MQTATRTAPPDMRQLAENMEAQRTRLTDAVYVFSPIFDMNCPKYPGGFIPHSRIVCCEAVQTPYNAIDALYVSESEITHRYPAPEGKTAVVLIGEPAAEYVTPALQQYQQNGAVSLPSMKGIPPRMFEDLQISDYITGPEPPRTAEGWLAQLKVVEEREASNPQIRALVGEMRQGILAGLAWAKDYINRRHAKMDLGDRSDEPTWYTAKDKRALEFAGITPRHEALDQMATAHLNMAKAAATPVTPQPVVVNVTIDGAALKQAVREAVAEEIGGPTAADVAPEAETKQQKPPKEKAK